MMERKRERRRGEESSIETGNETRERRCSTKYKKGTRKQEPETELELELERLTLIIQQGADQARS
jgi:hypothetical protein